MFPRETKRGLQFSFVFYHDNFPNLSLLIVVSNQAKFTSEKAVEIGGVKYLRPLRNFF